MPPPVTIPFQYKDGWFFALGGEYQWSDRLTLRAGAAYEISPIDDRVRIPLIPDNDRVWASIGASWQVWKGFSFDLAYTHIWVQDPSINITAVSGNPWFDGVNYIGSVNAHVDVLSLAMVFHLAAPAGAGGQADHRQINPRGREGEQGPAGDAGPCIFRMRR